MKAFILCAVAVAAVMLQGVAAQDCSPDCTGAIMGAKVEDPMNCTNYYVCFGDGLVSPEPVPCGEGQEFDSATKACVAEDPVTPCEPTCNGGDLGCTVTCPADPSQFAAVADATDCSKFYICYAGSVIPNTCSGGTPYFDSENEVCGSDATKCCNSVCEAYCGMENVNNLIPDPNDCKSYYYCEEEGAAEDKYKFTCGGSMNFNIQLGMCTSDAACVVICNGSGGDTEVPSDCADSLTCTANGYFAVCSYCDKHFFDCGSAGDQATIGNCPGDLLFDPTKGFCSQNCS